MSQYQVWQCRIYVAANEQLPTGFDAPPRSAAEMAIEAKGVNVIANFSGWGEKPKVCEVAVIENRQPNREAIESAATAPLLDRIAELEANEKFLLAQVQGHTKWRERIIKASEQAYGESAIRYKFSLTKSGKCMNEFPREIDGRWFALVPAEDDGHIGHIARIAELEERNLDLHEDVQRFRAHALNEKDARMALERELEAVRKGQP
jgi:hypothetical protein